MNIPLPFIFIVALAFGIWWLAPDSKVGASLDDLGSTAGSSGSTLLDSARRGAGEIAGMLSEDDGQTVWFDE